MNPLLHIRKKVLRISQTEMAEITATSQATVSRWESGELHPDLPQMASIREAARSRGVKWKDELFFSAPPSPSRSEVVV